MAINLANNNSLASITALPASISGGAMTLISTATASSSATIDFTSGIDSTYDEYVFKFIDIHPATDDARLTFQADTGTNTDYNETTTNASFRAYHTEPDDGASLDYQTSNDLAQSTAFIRVSESIGNDNDESMSGTLQIFNPSSSTFVKHYIARVSSASAMVRDNYIAGYFNVTTALTRFQFKMSSGNIDSGVIKLYGIS